MPRAALWLGHFVSGASKIVLDQTKSMGGILLKTAPCAKRTRICLEFINNSFFVVKFFFRFEAHYLDNLNFVFFRVIRGIQGTKTIS